MDEATARARLDAKLLELLDSVGELRVLDAGAGRKFHLNLPRPAHITGIDIFAEGMNLNEQLDERIVGDIETYPLERGAYDLVVCFDVLEHLRRPHDALANLATALRPGGVLVLALPNLLSLKGLATKLTPLRFHIWFARRVKGVANAGRPGYGPFKTYLRLSLTPGALSRFAHDVDLSVEQFDVYTPEGLRRLLASRRWLRFTWNVLAAAMRLATLGRATPDRTEMLVVLLRNSTT